HADQGIQYSYSRAGLAFDRHAQAQSISKAKQVFDLLSAIDHPDFEVIARESVRAADSYLAFRLVSHLAGRFDKHDRYLAFLESIRPSHHGLLETLIRHAEEVRRDRYIIVRRQRVQQPDLRFFLALLLNVPSRPQILEMVRYAYPGREPREAIVGWLTELSKLDAIHSWASATAMANEDAARDLVLDVPLNPAALRALPVLLGGGTDQAEAGTEALRCQTDDSPSKGLTELHSALRRSILLRPLFTSQISDR
ncbi:MAG TPA: hypothetical protein VGY54_01355, partial [Polyangiaceae bacterium]|nr:hypothetical protein [Polyangiaceae bacterium]